MDIESEVNNQAWKNEQQAIRHVRAQGELTRRLTDEQNAQERANSIYEADRGKANLQRNVQFGILADGSKHMMNSEAKLGQVNSAT